MSDFTPQFDDFIKYSLLCGYTLQLLSGVISHQDTRRVLGFDGTEYQKKCQNRRTTIWRSLEFYCSEDFHHQARCGYKPLPQDYNPCQFFYPNQNNGVGPQLIHCLPQIA